MWHSTSSTGEIISSLICSFRDAVDCNGGLIFVGEGTFFSLELGGGDEAGLLAIIESLPVIGSVLCCRSYGSEEEVLDLSICSGEVSAVTKEECPLLDSDVFLIWVTEGFRFANLLEDPELSCPAGSCVIDPSELPLLELCRYLSDSFLRESSPGSTYTISKLLEISDSVENNSDVNFFTPLE